MVKSMDLLNELNNQFNIKFNDIKYIRTGGSNSYEVNSGKDRYFLRVVSEAFKDTIEDSINVNRFLMHKKFNVPNIILNMQNEPSGIIEFEHKKYTYILYEFINGREPEKGESLKEIGELTGRLHVTMSDYTGHLSIRKKQFFILRYLDILKRKGYSHNNYIKYKEYGDLLWNRVAKLTSAYVHGDLHRGNLLKSTDGKIYVIDFDSSSIAPVVFDIMVMCDMTDYFEFNKQGLLSSINALHEFLAGYRNVCAILDNEVETFLDWIAIRHFQLQATIVEIHGADCIDEQFIDKQLDWLQQWLNQVEKYRK